MRRKGVAISLKAPRNAHEWQDHHSSAAPQDESEEQSGRHDKGRVRVPRCRQCQFSGPPKFLKTACRTRRSAAPIARMGPRPRDPPVDDVSTRARMFCGAG